MVSTIMCYCSCRHRPESGPLHAVLHTQHANNLTPPAKPPPLAPIPCPPGAKAGTSPPSTSSAPGSAASATRPSAAATAKWRGSHHATLLTPVWWGVNTCVGRQRRVGRWQRRWCVCVHAAEKNTGTYWGSADGAQVGQQACHVSQIEPQSLVNHTCARAGQGS